MPPLSGDAGAFVQAVSAATGIDPRVLIAWVSQEGADAPGGTGHYNFLNLRPYQGDPYTSVSPGGFEQFGNLKSAEQATIRRLSQPFASPILASAAAKQPPQQEIAAIASTGWDAAHYGGPGGPNLVAAYEAIFGPVGQAGGYTPPAQASVIAGEAGSPSAATKGLFGSGTLGGAPGVRQATSAVKSAAGAITSVEDALKFVFSARFAEILGGGLLVLVAVVSLARELGAPAPPLPGGLDRALGSAYAEGERQGQVAQAKKAGRQSVASAGPRSSEPARSASERRERINAGASRRESDIPF